MFGKYELNTLYYSKQLEDHFFFLLLKQTLADGSWVIVFYKHQNLCLESIVTMDHKAKISNWTYSKAGWQHLSKPNRSHF